MSLIDNDDIPSGISMLNPPTEDQVAELRRKVQQKAVEKLHLLLVEGSFDSWSIEPHGNAEVLYSGRWPWAHGYNMVYLTEPASQWDRVRDLMVASMNAAPALLDAVNALQETLMRVTAENRLLKRQLEEAKK